MARIELSDQDILDMAALAHAEAGSIAARARSSEDKTRAYASVIDTILNRTAAGGYGQGVRGVMNKPYAFSPVNPLGDVTRLPRAPGEVVDLVREHARRRAEGDPSSVGAATHFYNPAIASPSWGPKLGETTEVGRGQVAHRFGTLSSDPRPGAYEVRYDGKTGAFPSTPPSSAGSPPPSPTPPGDGGGGYSALTLDDAEAPREDLEEEPPPAEKQPPPAPPVETPAVAAPPSPPPDMRDLQSLLAGGSGMTAPRKAPTWKEILTKMLTQHARYT